MFEATKRAVNELAAADEKHLEKLIRAEAEKLSLTGTTEELAKQLADRGYGVGRRANTESSSLEGGILTITREAPWLITPEEMRRRAAKGLIDSIWERHDSADSDAVRATLREMARMTATMNQLPVPKWALESADPYEQGRMAGLSEARADIRRRSTETVSPHERWLNHYVTKGKPPPCWQHLDNEGYPRCHHCVKPEGYDERHP